MSHPSWTAPTGTRLTLDHDLRARPRKRPRETPSINLPPNSAPAKPRSHPTASHPPLRRLFASVPSPILSNKRFGNLLDPLFSDLLAIISKQFVLSWYARICPLKENTKPFSARVTQILIHLIRELERRCGALDPITLLLGDVPTLLNRHLHDIQQAHRRLSFQRQRGTEPEVTFDEVFMRLRPHPAIQLTTVLHSSSSVSPAGTLVDPIPKFPTARALPSPTYLRLLVEALMERVLPAEDWAPETERLIVREIIVNVVMAPLFCKLSEPSTIHRLLTIHLASLAGEPSPVPPSQSSLRGRLLGLLHQILHVLLLLPSLYQSLSQLPDIPSTASDPQLFNPLLTLLATVFGAEQRSHIAQLCWLLALAVRMFGGVLNRSVSSNTLLSLSDRPTVINPTADNPF